MSDTTVPLTAAGYRHVGMPVEIAGVRCTVTCIERFDTLRVITATSPDVESELTAVVDRRNRNHPHVVQQYVGAHSTMHRKGYRDRWA